MVGKQVLGWVQGGVACAISVGHPVGVGAPGTGVAPKIAPTPPLGFPTGA